MMLSDVCLTSVCLSVAYTWPKSRRETPMKTKIGTEVAHVTRDSDTTFKVKKVKGQGHRGRGHIVAASRTACFNNNNNWKDWALWRYANRRSRTA